MEDKGCKVAFIDGKVRVWKRNFKNAFSLGFRVGTLYQVAVSPLGTMSCATSLQCHQRVKKALYSFKKAPRAWNERIDSYLMKLRLTRSEVDSNYCFKVVDDRSLIMVLYVEYLFLTGTGPLIYKSKRELDFEFRMVECKLVTTPMEPKFKKLFGSVAGPNLGNASEFHQLIVALMFLVNSRLDICFAVSMLSQHMAKPHHSHWIGAKNLLRYLRGTITHGLRYTARVVRLHCYSDVDWACSVEDCKSTSECCFSLGSASISWMRRKQKSVVFSTAKARFY
eukprot:PITA_26918